MRVLSSVPGGEEFEVISKKYPQRTATGEMSSFEKRTDLYDVKEIDRVNVPNDAEAISLVLHGKMQSLHSNPADLARDLMYENGLCDDWGYRTNVDRDNRFSLEVFPEDFHRPSEYW